MILLQHCCSWFQVSQEIACHNLLPKNAPTEIVLYKTCLTKEQTDTFDTYHEPHDQPMLWGNAMASRQRDIPIRSSKRIGSSIPSPDQKPKPRKSARKRCSALRKKQDIEAKKNSLNFSHISLTEGFFKKFPGWESFSYHVTYVHQFPVEGICSHAVLLVRKSQWHFYSTWK